jgi:glycerol-3-phosphate acyltransferase PlsY
VSAATSFKWGARAGIFAYPVLQLAVDPVTHVMATGVLMTMIGALFGLDRLRGRAPQAA